MKNQVIEVLDKEHGKRVIEYWKSKGASTTGYDGVINRKDGNFTRFYGIINCRFGNYDKHEVELYKAEIITLPEDKPYPRVMEVSSDEKFWCKRVILMEKNGWYLAWNNAETLEDAEKFIAITAWKYAREIEEDLIVEITLEEIAKLKGVSVDKIRIKD